MEPIDLKQIPITGEAHISQADLDAARSSKMFTDWLASIDQQRLTVRSVHFQSVDKFGPRVGFIKFNADTEYDGITIPGIVFMRGGSVGILVVLKCQGKFYSLLTVQPRLATGCAAFVEIPAGSLDGSGNFAGVAARELDEEAGLKIEEDKLIDLSEMAGHDRGFFPSPGGCDEFIRLFSFCREVTQDELASMNGRLTGLLEEGEKITLKIVPLEDLWRIPDGKTVVAYTFYQKLCAEAAM